MAQDRSPEMARVDHAHAGLPIAWGLPVSIDPDDAQAEGVATTHARSDHQHAITTASPIALTAANTLSEGGSSWFARSDHRHAMGNFPWGVVAQQVVTSDGSVISAPGLTDMALSNVSVVQGRLYAIHLHTEVTHNDLGVDGRWVLVCRLNGVALDRFANVMPGFTGAAHVTVDATLFWEAPTTQATDDFTVFADELASTANIQLRGSATSRRTLTISDVGEAP